MLQSLGQIVFIILKYLILISLKNWKISLTIKKRKIKNCNPSLIFNYKGMGHKLKRLSNKN